MGKNETGKADKVNSPPDPRKEWRDPEGSILRQKVKKRDKTGKLREVEIIFARVRYTDENGTRREKKRQAKSAADAVIVRRQLHQEIADERRINGEEDNQPPKTFNQILDYFETEFVKEAVIVGDQKIEGYKEDLDTIRRQIARFRLEFGSKLAAKITFDDIKRYKIKRLKEPVVIEYYEKIALSAEEKAMLPKNNRRRFRYEKKSKSRPRKHASVHRELSRLRRIFNIAVRGGWIPANPFAQGESLIQPGMETARLRICSFEEEAALIAACTGKREHLEAIIRFALDTAMRKGEIFRLVWKDVDFARRRIFVLATNTKTGKSRYVPMTQRTIDYLTPLHKFDKNPAHRVFGIATDADRAWDSAVEAANIEGLTFHDLRATAITRMLRAGLHESEVMKISGHSQYAMFLKYVRQDEAGAMNSAAKMDAYLSDKSKA